MPEIPRNVALAAVQRYVETYEILTGRAFDLPPTNQTVIERIRGNLKGFMTA